ncbi:MAG: sigma-70 family RNA polymerase sigma factor [Sphingomicrobium sp.]
MDEPASSHPNAREELQRLLGQVAVKDRAALKAVYERTSAKLYGICLRLLRDEGEAQDVVQDLYVTVWNKAASYDANRSSPITWLATMARNRAIDRLRRRRVPTETIDVALGVADERPSSFDVLERAEDALRLHRCLEALEDKSRSTIRAAFFEGATYSELAQRDDIPLPTVKSWVRRGLMRLRKCLEQ